MRSTALKKYNNLLTSGRWSKIDNNNYHILDFIGLAQKVTDNSDKSPEKSNAYNRDPTMGEPAYTRDLPPLIMEDPKGGVGNKTKDGK